MRYSAGNMPAAVGLLTWRTGTPSERHDPAAGPALLALAADAGLAGVLNLATVLLGGLAEARAEDPAVILQRLGLGAAALAARNPLAPIEENDMPRTAKTADAAIGTDAEIARYVGPHVEPGPFARGEVARWGRDMTPAEYFLRSPEWWRGVCAELGAAGRPVYGLTYATVSDRRTSAAMLMSLGKLEAHEVDYLVWCAEHGTDAPGAETAAPEHLGRLDDDDVVAILDGQPVEPRPVTPSGASTGTVPGWQE